MDYTVPPAEPLGLKGWAGLFKHALEASSLLWCLLWSMAVLEGVLAVLLIAVMAPRLSSRIGIARHRVAVGWLRRHRCGSVKWVSMLLVGVMLAHVAVVFWLVSTFGPPVHGCAAMGRGYYRGSHEMALHSDPVSLTAWQKYFKVTYVPGFGHGFHMPQIAWADEFVMYRSQGGQDRYFDQRVFKGRRDGVYLDIGCNDGITGSNTYFFQHFLNWTGVCVEADPEMYAKIAIKASRDDGVHWAVVGPTDCPWWSRGCLPASSPQEGPDGVGFVSFTRVHDPDGGLSGVSKTIQIGSENEKYPTETFAVPAITPTQLLDKYYPASGQPGHTSGTPRTVIDLVSLDVEGAELPVLRTWPFSDPRWCVQAFSIENNGWCHVSDSTLPEMRRILAQHSYRHAGGVFYDEVFLREPPCPGTHLARDASPAQLRAANQHAVRDDMRRNHSYGAGRH